ncbi:hypothetical protein Y032_0774g2250 [Ancylostoma ceylanicum]|nr:hypothetical protein Y032_0774g2250 [Ancylostoma ceylanicum]
MVAAAALSRNGRNPWHNVGTELLERDTWDPSGDNVRKASTQVHAESPTLAMRSRAENERRAASRRARDEWMLHSLINSIYDTNFISEYVMAETFYFILQSFTLWSALPPELRFFIMLFVDFDTQETCIVTNKETRLWTIAVRKSRRETVIKRAFNKQQSEQQSASIVFASQAEAGMVNRRCSAQIRLQAVLF